jgi:hypothetical protein
MMNMDEGAILLQALAMLQLDWKNKKLQHVSEPVVRLQGDCIALLKTMPTCSVQSTVQATAQRFGPTHRARRALPSFKPEEVLCRLQTHDKIRVYLTVQPETRLDLLIIDHGQDRQNVLSCLFFPENSMTPDLRGRLAQFNHDKEDPRSLHRGTERYSLQRLKRFLAGFEWFLDAAQRPHHLQCQNHPPSWAESGAEGIFRAKASKADPQAKQSKQDSAQVERIQAVVQHLGQKTQASQPIQYAPPRAGGWRTRGTTAAPNMDREVSGASSEDWQGEGSIAARILHGVGIRPLPDLRELFRPSQ